MLPIDSAPLDVDQAALDALDETAGSSRRDVKIDAPRRYSTSFASPSASSKLSTRSTTSIRPKTSSRATRLVDIWESNADSFGYQDEEARLGEAKVGSARKSLDEIVLWGHFSRNQMSEACIRGPLSANSL